LSPPSGAGGRARFEERRRAELGASTLARKLRRNTFICTLILVAAVLGYCGWSLYRYAWCSEYFKVRDLRITVVSEELKRDAQGLLDKRLAEEDNLLRLNPAYVAGMLGNLPRSKAVAVTKIYPGTLIIEFVERTPIIVARMEEHYLMDEEGVLLAAIAPAKMRQTRLPLLTGLTTERPAQAGARIEYERLGDILTAVKYIRDYEPILQNLIVEWNVNSKTGVTAVLNTHCDVQFGVLPPMQVLDKLIAGLEMEKDLEHKKTIDLRFDPRLIYE
jgi:cell division septal protein FtsQ